MEDFCLWSATTLGVVLHVPQLVKTYRSKQTAAFHKGTIVLRFLANVFFAVFAHLTQLWVLFAASAFNATCELLLLLACFMYAGAPERATTTASEKVYITSEDRGAEGHPPT